MKIIQVFINNSLRNFNYILYSEINNQAIIFDPTDIRVTRPVWEKQGLTPRYLINTHQHHDHIADNEAFLKLPDTELVKLKDGEEFFLSPTEKIICRFTPGHVMDHQCFFIYAGDEITGVICGDTIFNAGIGNIRGGGNIDTYYETMRDIFLPLNNNIIIYPSHDYFLNNLNFAKTVDPNNQNIQDYILKREAQNLDKEFMLTTIGEERIFNPFFRAFQSEYREQFNKTEKELFVYLRQQRDKW